MNFQCEDRVVYGIQGVCRIIALERRNVDRKMVEYYVLAPCGPSDARYYVPVHNQAAVSKMRKLLSPAELNALLDSPEVRKDCWIPEENLRKERYRHLISHGDCTELIGMVRSLLQQKQIQLEAGRKFHISDENFLKDAKRLIGAEVAEILNVSPQEAEAYLRSRLEE